MLSHFTELMCQAPQEASNILNRTPWHELLKIPRRTHKTIDRKIAARQVDPVAHMFKKLRAKVSSNQPAAPARTWQTGSQTEPTRT